MEKMVKSHGLHPLSFAILIFACLAFTDTLFFPQPVALGRAYNGEYSGEYLNRIAFPIGGIGAGMFCLEGTGAISHMSVRNKLNFQHEPLTFSAICIKGEENIIRVLEGQVPKWKILGTTPFGAGTAVAGQALLWNSYGLPRFKESSFLARFPFGIVTLCDTGVPLRVTLTGWSPFIPGDEDNSSLPVGAFEYCFENTSNAIVEAIFSFHSRNFMNGGLNAKGKNAILPMKNGIVLHQEGTDGNPEHEGCFAIAINDDNTVIDHCWFRGAQPGVRYVPLTFVGRNIEEGRLVANPPVEGTSPGASLYLPFSLPPGGKKEIQVMFAWYVPNTDIRTSFDPQNESAQKEDTCCCMPGNYIPWYAQKFKDIYEVADYWRFQYERLRRQSALFKDTFYDTSLPDEVIEAVAANLTILKTPTILRQSDGKLWCYEGCGEYTGCCPGSCTHVWNYAQAIAHLFPRLERTFRQTEFNESQDEKGRQAFRTPLPIRPVAHTFFAAADGQLGGIMKMYREWRISGDTAWLQSLWHKVKQSLDYCIRTWDPGERGVIEEPHHNTYDIEFWGANGFSASFYLGALTAAIEMGKELNEDVSRYQELLRKGKSYLETDLYNGEYFYQKAPIAGFTTPLEPIVLLKSGPGYKEITSLINKEGPINQYGAGCLSDGVLGFWLAQMCGMGDIIDREKIKSHIKAVYRYNFKRDLSEVVNPLRAGYAIGNEGGLLLCTWPKDNKPQSPFYFSTEVWTGIEYQVASHLMLAGMVEEGLEIVRAARQRYDGRYRNPFSEFECGYWYARALSSYGLLQGLTGIRYDAITRSLFINSQIGSDFRSFFAAEKGFGTVGLKNGKPLIDIKKGHLEIRHLYVSGREVMRYE